MTVLLPATCDNTRFITPPLGLEPRTDFDVQRLAADQGLYALVHADGVRVRVLDTTDRVPGYAAEQAERYRQVVDAVDAAQVQVLVMLTVHDGVITANLDAPVIVNRVTGCAQQVIRPGVLDQLQVPVKALLRL